MIIKNNRLRKRKFYGGGEIPSNATVEQIRAIDALNQNTYQGYANSGNLSVPKQLNNKLANRLANAGAYSAGFLLTDKLISGNKQTKVGSSLVGIGGAVATVNPLIGGGIATLGTLYNLGFGNDAEAIKKYNTAIGDMAAYNVDGSTTQNVAAASAKLPTQINVSRSKFGWFNGSDYRRYKRDMNTANLLANNLLTNATTLANKNITNNAMRNVAAFGGPLSMLDTGSSIGYELANRYLDNGLLKALNKGILNDNLPSVLALGGDMQSHGLDFPTGMIHIDKGGTHETNPYEGVPMGVDQEGTPNLVEEGETVYNDYVFSNRLTVPIKLTGKNKKLYAKGGKLHNEVTYEDKVLKRFEGMTYADAAKKAEGGIMGYDYNNQLLAPRNPYDQQALEAILQVLASSQELVKQEEQTELIQEMVAQMSPEEQEMLMREIAAQQLQAPQELMENPQFMPEELYSPYELPDAGLQYIDSYGNMMAACGGKLRAKGGNLNVPVETIFNQPLLSKANLFKEGGPMDEKALRRWLRRQYKKKGIDPDKMEGLYQLIFERDLAALESAGEKVEDERLFINRFQVPQDKKQLDLAFRDTIRKELIAESIGDQGYLLAPNGDSKTYAWDPQRFDQLNNLTPIGVDRTGTFKNGQWWYDDNLSTPYVQGLFPDLFGDDSAYKLISQTVPEEDWGLDISHYDLDNLGWINSENQFTPITLDGTPGNGNLENTYPPIDWLKKIYPDLTTYDALGQRYRLSDPYERYNYALQRGVLDNNPAALKRLFELGEISKGSSGLNRYFKEGTTADNLSADMLREGVFNGLDASNYDAYTLSVIQLLNQERNNPDGSYAYAAYYNPVALAHLMAALKERPKEERRIYALMNDAGELITDENGRYNYVEFDPLNPLGYDVSPSALTTFDPEGRNVGVYGVRANKDRYIVRDQFGRDFEVSPDYILQQGLTELTDDELKKNPRIGFNRPEGVGGKDHFYLLTAEGTDSLLTLQGQQTDGNTGIKNPEMGDYPKPPMWPFLALLGLQVGAMVPSLLKPDYSNADAIINAAKQAGNFTPYDPKYIGNYIAYRPLDRNWESNKLAALASANARQINNISGGNRGALMAGNLSNMYTAGLNMGNVDRQAAEANRLDEFEKFKANRETDIFNATAYNQALRDNQEAASRAMTASLSGLAEGYKMRELIDSERSKALSAGLTNIGTILDTYGRTKFANDLMAWYLPKVGVNWVNDPLDVYLQGRTHTAKGGKLKRRKHSLNF